MRTVFSDNDIKYLRRAIGRNEVVLFLGAGFSVESLNKQKSPIPAGPQLSEKLWQYLEYPGTFDRTSLQMLFEAALRSPKGHAQLREFLESELLASDIPKWYDFLTKAYWYRIYSMNVDDVVEKVFQRASGSINKLDSVNAVSEDFRDRDQFLKTIQFIKLHGSLPGDPQNLTFSIMQYASRSVSGSDIWYSHFVRDYITHPTIFVGTELEDPIFYQYLAAREGRTSKDGGRLDFPERRFRSYLVSPVISRPKVEFIESLNIAPVTITAREFFDYLFDQIGPLPHRHEIIQFRHPDIGIAVSQAGRTLSPHETRDLEDFYKCFQKVPPLEHKSGYSKNYLLGYNPGWQDLANNHDAPREITRETIESIRIAYEQKALSLLTVIGSAGSGKTTLLMRTAVTLHKEGYPVLFSDGTQLPQLQSIRTAFDLIPDRAILLIDNAEIIGPRISDLLKTLLSLEKPPVVLIASQANLYDRVEKALVGNISPSLRSMPHLAEADIINILTVLRHNGLLGQLQGKNLDEQKRIFMIRARSQILVAMKEATRGRGFDEIIREEYHQIEPENARIVLLCVALVSAENMRLKRDQLVACSNATSYETLGYLDRTLRDVVIEDPINRDTYSLRHAVIAREIVQSSAPKNELCEAYKRLLSVLSSDFDPLKPPRSRTYRTYQLIINHRTIYERFEQELDSARSIFEAIKPKLQNEWQFWLQYGSLELEYGELELAENYLDQAFSLRPDADYVIHARAHLWFRQAFEATSFEKAVALRGQAEESLNQQFKNERLVDPYPYHILGKQLLYWIKKWVRPINDRKTELRKLKRVMDEARDRFPINERLRLLEEEVTREYLSLGVE